MSRIAGTFLIFFSLSLGAEHGLLAQSEPAVPAGLVVQSRFLDRTELPDDFKFPLLELDFAVLELSVTNGSPGDFQLDPARIEVRDPKGKEMERALSTDITPRIMNSDQFKRSHRNVHGQVGTIPPGAVYFPPVHPRPGSSIPDGSRTRSANTATVIRETLEQHEIQAVTLPPGQSMTALLYLKSKKRPGELKDCRITIR